jgi:cathepsin L
MKLLLLTALLGVSLAAQADYSKIQFATFKELHGKHYSSLAEYNLRLGIFRDNLAKIEEHNQSGASWKKSVNEFSDLTEAEFEALYMGGYKRLPQSGAAGFGLSVAKTAADLPASIDWRDKGVVSAVKNQGQCGSCWAFCTTEQIESFAAINTGTLINLSSQQVTACTPNPQSCGGTGGCQGSIPQLGYTYIQLFGHVSSSDYPYTAGSGSTGSCDYDYSNSAPVVGITGYNTLTPNDQDAVMTHLAEVGPLGVAVYASGWGSYGGGVYSGCSYSSNIALNHAVQLVGYGTDSSLGDYWIVRNSWGSSWGESGYIRLKRDSSAQCGTDSSPMDGTACQGGPGNDEQHVCGQCGVLFDVSWPLGAHEFSKP